MLLLQLLVGDMRNFTYIVADEKTGEAAVVDPSWEVERVLTEARRNNLTIRNIINTHSHIDHVIGNEAVVRETGASIVAHEKAPIAKDRAVRDGDEIAVGSIRIKVLYTPGHTADGICLLVGNKLLTGDTLFVGNCGRTDLPGASAEALYESLHHKLMRLDDRVEVYPGHDYGKKPYSTIGDEKRDNYVLRFRSKEAFVRFMGEP